jgi:hypothetical protein
MRVQFLGSGDGLGSGGRFQTCLHLTSDDLSLLVACRAPSNPSDSDLESGYSALKSGVE